MTLSAEFVSRLEDDPDRIAALAYLAEKATRYPPGIFTPALERPKNDDKDKPFAALWLGRGWNETEQAAAIGAASFCIGGRTEWHITDDNEELAAWFSSVIFTRKNAGLLIVSNGGTSGVLDVVLGTTGPHLLLLGYSLEPCLGQHGISWMKVRKGKRTWTLTTVETMTGVDVDTLLDSALIASDLFGTSQEWASGLYAALSAYTSFLSVNFGSALRPTIGMIASNCARRFLPQSVVKWRPNPLLVAMEIEGKGYRGGITYGRKFRGEMHRIDVNRQYTALLRQELPMEATFTKWKGATDGRQGVFMCTIEAESPVACPVGSWQPSERRFAYGGVDAGRTVCVLHTADFPGLYAQGVRITPGWGFAFTSTFSLSSYVDRIEDVTRRHGRNSAIGRLTKPLGNMVYGKFGQRPDRWQLLYSIEPPDKTWYPYFNDAGEDIPGVWERQQTRYSSGQHVDIAAHITAHARSQTLQAWADLEAMGYTVVRAHTDSITTYGDPREVMATDAETFGAWKYEGADSDGIIVGANSFVDSRGGHIAGISAPTREDIEAIRDGGSVTITRRQNAPRQGWQRGTREVTRTLTG